MTQDGDVGHGFERAEDMLGEPPDVGQASQRPPCADEGVVDAGGVAGDDVAKVFGVSACESCEVEQSVALGGFGPVDDAAHFVTVDEDVVEVQIAVDEARCPRPECCLGESAVPCHDIGGKDVVGDESAAFLVQAPSEFVEGPARPGRQRRVVQRPDRSTRCSPRGRRRCAGLAEMAERFAWQGGERERGWLAPQDLQRRDRHHRHCFDLDAGVRVIAVDLHEHIAHAKRRAFLVGDDRAFGAGRGFLDPSSMVDT